MGCGSSSAAGDTSNKGIRLSYFNARGRGELSRLILAASGTKYEDNRIEQAEWPDLKPKTPLGTLPVLEVDGKVIVQSVCVARYLARKCGLAGKSVMDQAIADLIVETCADIRSDMGSFIFEKDQAKKASMVATFLEEKLPMKFKLFEKILSENGNYFVGTTMTWADLAVMEILDQAEGTDLFDKMLDFSPKLKEHRERIRGIPKIKTYVENRPVTSF